MNQIKFSKKEYSIAKFVVLTLVKAIKKQHPKLKKFDSNIIHFVVCNVSKKEKLNITGGWFKYGPYFPVVDDILIDLGWMDKSQHQLYGNEKALEEWIQCDCHKKVKK